MTFSEQINDLFEREKWTEARRLLERRCKAEPLNHWLLTRLGTTYYEQEKYKKALEFSLQAYKAAPTCLLVLWDLASTYEMLGEDAKAARIYKKLFRLACRSLRGEGEEEEHNEGPRWLNSLTTDCLYSVAGCLFRLGLPKEAHWFVREHLEWRIRGTKSIYPLKAARGLLREILKALPADTFAKGVEEAGDKLELVDA